MFKLRQSFERHTIKQFDGKRRKFFIDTVKIVSFVGAIFAFIPFISSLNPNKKILRNNEPLRVDVSNLRPGAKMTVVWHGKPIWILHRTSNQLKEIEALNPNLNDPDSAENQQPKYAKNIFRARNPKYVVLVGLCTHLGCSPKLEVNTNGDGKSSFFCPCHGSRFDLSGRVYKNVPAPTNLAVPPYYFLNDTTLVIGEDHA